MGMATEFREFIAKGNVIDLAVGVIIGASFGKIVTSLVEQIVMPPIGLALGGVDFSKLEIVLKPEDPATARYGESVWMFLPRSVAGAALYDGSRQNETQLFVGTPGTRATAKQIREVDSGTAETLGDFLNLAMKVAPAQRKHLVMADHGGGIIRGICSDWNGPGGKKIIHVNEVAAAMRQQPADIMMFDACFMGMAEVAFELKDSAKVVIGAQTTTRGDFPYEDLVETLDKNAGTDTGKLAATMTQAIAANARYSGVAFGAMDTAKVATAAASVGVARPIAHGQAVTTTAMKAVRARVSRGSTPGSPIASGSGSTGRFRARVRLWPTRYR